MRQTVMALAAGLLSWGLTGLVLAAARQSQHLALPTERGLHKSPTPVGGGLGLVGAALVLWLIFAWPASPMMLHIIGALVALIALSWIDDRTPLPPAIRFAAQAIVVGAMLWLLPRDWRLVPHLPLLIERAGLAVAWLWMLNLTNFMDGIDGLAGSEAVTVSGGYALVMFVSAGHSQVVEVLPELALLVAAAGLGYLYWNWAPAQIFMGDVGSIPLGFLFGLLMLDLALRGQWAAALILPMYFVADATITLLDRLRRGETPWKAHREHAYQHAVLAGMSHDQVTLHVLVLNIALVGLAVLSVHAPAVTFAAAVALTLALVVWLRSRMVTAA